jgi:hypothetical protein
VESVLQILVCAVDTEINRARAEVSAYRFQHGQRRAHWVCGADVAAHADFSTGGCGLRFIPRIEAPIEESGLKNTLGAVILAPHIGPLLDVATKTLADTRSFSKWLK